MRVPTDDELRLEITQGPLATACTPHWQTVFPHPEPEPAQGTFDEASHADHLRAWQIEVDRTGHLHPDAAHALFDILTPRFQDLEWAVSPGHLQGLK